VILKLFLLLPNCPYLFSVGGFLFQLLVFPAQLAFVEYGTLGFLKIKNQRQRLCYLNHITTHESLSNLDILYFIPEGLLGPC